MTSHLTKKCPRCSLELPPDAFGRRLRRGRTCLSPRCLVCEAARDRERRTRVSPDAKQKKAAKQTARRREARLRGERAWATPLYDSRRRDKAAGVRNDLTKEFVVEMLGRPCSYCGTSDSKITLDRLDNAQGHTMDNVVPACLRCNLTRGNMPLEAWRVVARGMREAQELGLFGDWQGPRVGLK